MLNSSGGETMSATGVMNPQIAYGEDVVARMAYAQQDPKQAARIQGLVVEALNTAIASSSGGSDMAIIAAAAVLASLLFARPKGMPRITPRRVAWSVAYVFYLFVAMMLVAGVVAISMQPRGPRRAASEPAPLPEPLS